MVSFSNVGQDNWALILEDMLYEGKQLAGDDIVADPKIALIDTSNSTIQLPEP